MIDMIGNFGTESDHQVVPNFSVLFAGGIAADKSSRPNSCPTYASGYAVIPFEYWHLKLLGQQYFRHLFLKAYPHPIQSFQSLSGVF